MINQDDSDIKIFRKKTKEETDDALDIAIEVKRHRLNGNFAKAKRLGSLLAEIAPECVKDATSSDYIDDPDILYQIKVLSIFTAESTIHTMAPNQSLATATVNAMYDSLIDVFPGIYTNISDGTAYSLYYLKLRKGVEVENAIGKTFAKLCGDKENQSLIALGTKIYTELRQSIKTELDNAGFVE